jgi:TolA-binding protein
VLLNRGLCAELLGDADTARRQYTILTEEYPGSLETGLAADRLKDLEIPLIAAAPQ